MTWLRILRSRWAALFRIGRLERELKEELHSHLKMLAEENVRKGMSLEEARYAALRSFGGVEQVKEIYRKQRGLPMIETLVQDLRYALRVLGRTPGFTAVTVLTLAIVGVALGLPATLATTRLLTSMLFGLTTSDPPTILSAALLLTAVAAFAGYLPARRASRVDPMEALRHE